MINFAHRLKRMVIKFTCVKFRIFSGNHGIKNKYMSQEKRP